MSGSYHAIVSTLVGIHKNIISLCNYLPSVVRYMRFRSSMRIKFRGLNWWAYLIHRRSPNQDALSPCLAQRKPLQCTWACSEGLPRLFMKWIRISPKGQRNGSLAVDVRDGSESIQITQFKWTLSGNPSYRVAVCDKNFNRPRLELIQVSVSRYLDLEVEAKDEQFFPRLGREYEIWFVHIFRDLKNGDERIAWETFGGKKLQKHT